jgi:hypothetical protein
MNDAFILGEPQAKKFKGNYLLTDSRFHHSQAPKETARKCLTKSYACMTMRWSKLATNPSFDWLSIELLGARHSYGVGSSKRKGRIVMPD